MLRESISHPSLSHIEQECQESLIQGKTHIEQNLDDDVGKAKFE